MSTDYRIFVVDDDKTMRLILQTSLAEHYTVESFDSAEQCLQALEHQTPNVLLLDVGLEGMDGYALCRRLRQDQRYQTIPVLFISGHDNLEDILAGYDAGAQDYIVKPFDTVEIYRKIENLRRIEHEHNALQQQARSSDELTSLLLSNLDEYAALIGFLRRLNECFTYNDVAAAVLNAIEASHLNGTIQLRLPLFEKTLNKQGENWPLERAVIHQLRTQGRIFEFKTHAIFNFDHLSILITNMPLHDPELCGRIRDNLAICAESADAKLAAILSMEDNGRIRGDIHALLQNLQLTLSAFNQRHESARYQSGVYSTELLEGLMKLFDTFGLTEHQESEVIAFVAERSERITALYDFSDETRSKLEELSGKLKAIVSQPGSSLAEAG